MVFGAAWVGRKYSIKSRPRPFARSCAWRRTWCSRLDQMHADGADFRAIGRVIAPWGRRIGDQRFESEGAWKRDRHHGRHALAAS